MANLHFKDCSEIFNPFIQKSKTLKIGISAYKAFVDKKLLEFTQLVRSIYDGSQESLDEAGHNVADYVMISTNIDGVNRMVATQLLSLNRLANGDMDKVPVYFCNPNSGNFGPLKYLRLEDLNQFITDKISCLQGQAAIFGAALKQDLNDTFSIQTLLSEMALRGFDTSDYLQSLVAGVTSGMTWADILALIAGNIKEPETDENGYWYFDPESFSDTNSLVLGLSSIANSVSGFFSNIKFSIRKIGDFFKNLWKGITDLATWIITMLAGDLFTDYIVKKDYTLEGFNIPIASVHCNISSISNNRIVERFYQECLDHPDKISICKGMVSASDNSYDGNIYQVDFKPDLGQIIANAAVDVKDNTTRVIPWSNGFIAIVRNGDDLTVYYFLGDFSSINGFSRWSISSDGEITIKNELIYHKSYHAVEFKTNNDFKTWFSSLFVTTPDNLGSTIIADDDFIGNGRVGDTSTGYENYLSMSVNLNNIDGPGSVVSQFEKYYFSDVTTKFAAQLLVNALVYNNIFACDTVRGGVYLTNGEGSNVHYELNFNQTNFLPYETNHMINFEYHAQSDTERANEVIELLKKIAIAAVAVGTAVAAVKINKAIKIKSYRSQLEANDAWRAANLANPEDRLEAIKLAYNAQRKANIWSRIGSLIGGRTVNSSINDALSSISLPNISGSESDLLYEVITGETL